MKKLLISSLVLLLLGGTVFYFGWVQMDIPPNTYGVVFTKTGGWEDSPLVPGEFAWQWEKLIPGNFQLHLYPDRVRSVDLAISGELPSAGTYSLFLDGKPFFGYELRLNVSYRLRGEYFPILAKVEGVLPEDIDAWAESNRNRLSEEARFLVTSLFTSGPAPSPGNLLPNIAGSLREGIAQRFPHLEITSVTPLAVSVPDVELYRKGRELYLLFLEAKRPSVEGEARLQAVESMKEERRMETLEKYGALLTKYPILIEYLLVERLNNLQLSDLERLRRSSGTGN